MMHALFQINNEIKGECSIHFFMLLYHVIQLGYIICVKVESCV